jgi:hypothetical protein
MIEKQTARFRFYIPLDNWPIDDLKTYSDWLAVKLLSMVSVYTLGATPRRVKFVGTDWLLERLIFTMCAKGAEPHFDSEH